MADVQANIVLTTTGGSAAAEEVDKAGNAIRNLTTASSGMEAQFQHRFQHIGLMLFAGDALRASGLGAETRQVIGALNTALIAGETAFGAAAGPVFLFVAALTAVAGIVVKVIEHHQSLIASLEQVHSAQQASIQSLDANVKSIDNYIAAGGEVTPAINAWKDAENNLLAAQIKRQIVTDQQLVSELKTVIADDQRKDKTLSLAQSYELLGAAVLRQAGATQMADSIIQRVTASINNQNLALEQNKAHLAEVQIELDNLQKGTITDFKAMSDAAVQHRDAVIKATHDEMEARREAQDKEDQHEREIMDYHVQKFIDGQHQMEKESEAALKKMADVVKGVSGQIGNDLGSAFAKSLVEGKDFTAQMQDAFKRMAEQIIEKIIQMIVEWEVFTALTGFGPTAGIGAAGLKSLGFATGGSAVVDQPTMFMAGEAGPELATFSPLGSSGGGSSGGGTVNNINVSVTANGIDDPQELARKVGPAIIQEIRGMGQLNFTRA